MGSRPIIELSRFDRLDHPIVANFGQLERPLPTFHLRASADARHIACDARTNRFGAGLLDVGLATIECDALLFELVECLAERS